MNLLVILGAGATYDSIPTRRVDDLSHAMVRPPLADDLFTPREKFLQAMQLYRPMAPIIPLLQQRQRGEGVEQVLQRLRDEEGEYEQRTVQLMATRFYLQLVVWQSTNEWSSLSAGATSYATLVDQLRHRVREPDRVAFLTLNYDTMLEDALLEVRGQPFGSVADYLEVGRWQVFKLHGSVNWGRIVRTSLKTGALSQGALAEALIGQASALALSDNYCVVSQPPSVRLGNDRLIPAIAIPVVRKSEFECPSAHVQALQESLHEVERILVIGWRAQEHHVLELLRQNIGHQVRGLVICGSEAASAETVGKLSAGGTVGTLAISGVGFSASVTNGEIDAFLTT